MKRFNLLTRYWNLKIRVFQFVNNCKIFSLTIAKFSIWTMIHFVFANSNRSKKWLIAFFPRKKNNVNFFSKIDNDNLITKNNNAFFFTKTKTHFVQKRIKTISNEKIKIEINVFSKKKRRRYKTNAYFETNENYFTIFRKNLFRICRNAFINYYDFFIKF